MSAPLLDIYRHIEKLSSFLLDILSHANGASSRVFPLFQQRSGCGGTAGYWVNSCILCKIRRGSAQPGKLLGIGSVGQAQLVASRVLEGVVVTYMGAWFL
tara:strand:+ start:244 stop:543 length:300 start_codon:yes stop_codon:yes gene_type:complete